MKIAQYFIFPTLGLAALILGCAGTDEPRRPRAYSGEVQLARLADVRYHLADGDSRRFAEVFPSFATGSAFGPGLPLTEAPIREVSYDALEQALPHYDANRNARIERPELVVLYLVELARGVGLDVQSVGAGTAARAIALSAADERGLAALARSQRSALLDAQAQIFRELEWLGTDRRRFSIDVSSSN